jgi:alpha-L-rhamnosidase
MSMYGKIESAWKIADGLFNLTINVPANTRATVRLPSAQLEKVTESNQPLNKAKGVFNTHQDGNVVVAEVGSGSYSFSYIKGN